MTSLAADSEYLHHRQVLGLGFESDWRERVGRRQFRARIDWMEIQEGFRCIVTINHVVDVVKVAGRRHRVKRW